MKITPRHIPANSQKITSKHSSATPGPWSMEKDDVSSAGEWLYSIRSGDELIAHGVSEHNARLIAAAPELLEALEAIRARITGTFDQPALLAFGQLSNRDDDCLAIAEIAIVKARSQS